jgi:hypothetical protein
VRSRLAARQLTDIRVLGVDPVHGAVNLAQRVLDAEQSVKTKEIP